MKLLLSLCHMMFLTIFLGDGYNIMTGGSASMPVKCLYGDDVLGEGFQLVNITNLKKDQLKTLP